MNEFFKNKNQSKIFGEKTEKTEEEDNKLYKSLKGMWNDKQISIVNNILEQVEAEPKNRNDWLSALDTILNNKETNVYSIITKTNTTL